MRALVIVTVVFASVAVSRASAAPPSGIPFAVEGDGAVIVPVTIGGLGPFRFLIDTGSNRSAVSDAVAVQLALPVVARTSLVTSTGTVVQPVVRLPELALGPMHAAGLLATAIPASRVRAALGPDVAGLIGQDFLSQFAYTIDYRHRRLRMNDEAGAPEEHDVRLALHEDEGRFLVDLPQDAACGCVLRFVPDSGAGAMVLFEGAGGPRLPLQSLDRGDRVTAMSGSATGRAVLVTRLQIGSAVLRNQPGTAIRRDDPDAPHGDGLLPLHLFASVTFNSRDGYVVLRPR